MFRPCVLGYAVGIPAEGGSKAAGLHGKPNDTYDKVPLVSESSGNR